MGYGEAFFLFGTSLDHRRDLRHQTVTGDILFLMYILIYF
jgi:hypothetical protein